MGLSRKGIPWLLQDRCGEQRVKSGDRGRWSGTLGEESACNRRQKNGEIEILGVDSVASYEQGGDAGSPLCVITDPQTSQQYVEMFDLEVEGHSSYYANNVLVHNCHQLSKDAQSALLKALEDTPPHVYFILCTTDPVKLLPTIRTRCSSFEVRALTEAELIAVMSRVIKRENKEVHEDVLAQIARDATGSARMALVILEKIVDLAPDQQLEAAKQRALEENQVIELCRLMFKGTDWSAVIKVLSSLKEEPESIRRAILGYCNSILMKKKDARAYVVMSCFRENYYDTARAGLTMSCFEAVESASLK